MIAPTKTVFFHRVCNENTRGGKKNVPPSTGLAPLKGFPANKIWFHEFLEKPHPGTVFQGSPKRGPPFKPTQLSGLSEEALGNLAAPGINPNSGET